MKSIIDDSENCYICQNFKGITTKATDTHHCIGAANRKKATADGLTVRLCRQCHRLLHDQNLHYRDLQQIAERTYLEHYNKTVDDFIKRYGKNYLD